MKIVHPSNLSPSLVASPLRALYYLPLLLFAVAAAGGTGDLLVAPTRVILEGRQRTAEISLVNIGSKVATYRISLINLRMDKEGGTKEIEAGGAEPGERFATELIRYSPRQVTLEPQVAQTVRIQVRKPAELEPGEYRSHLLFRAVPVAEPAAGNGEPAAGVRIKLTAIYGVSIPVIVRQGETTAEATLSDLELVPPAGSAKDPTLRFRINRTGNRSIYGDFTVTYVPAGGEPRVVGRAKGVAVYTPNSVRVAGIGLHPGAALKNGLLRLTYTKQDGGNETIAKAELRVP